MMYEQMIEEIEQERQEYIDDRDRLFKNGNFGSLLTVANTKIYMCNRFISFLKSVEEQEMALEAENEILKSQK